MPSLQGAGVDGAAEACGACGLPPTMMGNPVATLDKKIKNVDLDVSYFWKNMFLHINTSIRRNNQDLQVGEPNILTYNSYNASTGYKIITNDP